MMSKYANYFNWLCRYLWLSVSSVGFYRDIRKKYTGYGIKYIFVICFISSLIYSISLFSEINRFKEYFCSDTNEAAEYIFSQIPDIYYDGQGITTNVTLPHFIYDLHRRKFAVIDLNGELSVDERAKIPIVFTKKNIIISIIEMAAQKRDDLKLAYPRIFGDEARSFTGVSLKEYFAHLFSYSSRICIYIIMPLLILARFVGVILEKSLAIIAIYILSNAIGKHITVQVACRLVMFASGVSVLLQPIINITLPQASSLALILQIIPGALLVMSLVQSKLKRRK